MSLAMPLSSAASLSSWSLTLSRLDAAWSYSSRSRALLRVSLRWFLILVSLVRTVRMSSWGV